MVGGEAFVVAQDLFLMALEVVVDVAAAAAAAVSSVGVWMVAVLAFSVEVVGCVAVVVVGTVHGHLQVHAQCSNVFPYPCVPWPGQ